MPSLGWTTNEAVAPAAMAMPVAGWAGPIPTALTVAAPAAMVTNMRVANGLEVAVPDAGTLGGVCDPWGLKPSTPSISRPRPCWTRPY
jgi:hypothetical protein